MQKRLSISLGLVFSAMSIFGTLGSAQAATLPSEATPIYETLSAGETLWSLSTTYEVSVHHLEKWNDLSDSSVLQIGQKVIVGWKPQSADLKENSQVDSGDGTLGENFVSYAEQFTGVPYLWGGESPKGFDCSGLVQYTLEHFGVSVPRTSYDQFNAGTSVASADLEPGDLVFFDSDGPGASHDGIYVGNGQFVNADNNGVEVVSMVSGYWAEHYIGARRVR